MTIEALKNLKIIEFTHMVMGPCAGHILSSLGANVTRIEPIGGDATRKLVGSGAGYFPMYNRHKSSVSLDLKSPEGKEIAKNLCLNADIVIENFRPGAMEKLGLGFDELFKENKRIIYCSLKGFLPGPYENRTALDEVAQMMGGLAYMTGPPGRPLRAGASVIDVTGGMFGVISILAAVNERNETGIGQCVKSSLFETTAYLVGQHMAQFAVTGKPAAPMPARISAWSIYDVFETKDNMPIFVGVVTDSLWEKFCHLFGFSELWQDVSLRKNNDRVARRDQILPIISEKFLNFTHSEMVERLDGSGLPFAPISKPEDLFNDPHLSASGALEKVQIDECRQTDLPVIPIEMQGNRSGGYSNLSRIGAGSKEALLSIGYSESEIRELSSKGIVQCF